MKLKCLAVDDERPALEKLKKYIGQVPYLELVDCCDNALDALSCLEFRKDIDAIFVDINMPDMNGLDFVDKLTEPRPFIVFITAYPHYAAESYRTGAVDYLIKPYNFEDFCRAAGRIVERVNINQTIPSYAPEANKSIFIKVDNRWIKLDPNEVEYIRSFGDYLRIYVADRPNPYVTYSTLTSIRELLPSDFLQVHRSYVVNMNDGVLAIERSRIITRSNEEIPVGESYRDTVNEYLSQRSLVKDSKKKA